LHFWIRHYGCNKFVDVLKCFKAVDMDGNFPMSLSM
jgi:hypothetical protein